MTNNTLGGFQTFAASASKARADIHIAEELSFFLHSRKAAWSPFYQMLRGVRMAAMNLMLHL